MVYDREQQINALPDYQFSPSTMQGDIRNYHYPPICPSCQYQMMQPFFLNPQQVEQYAQTNNRRNPNVEQHIMQQFLNENGQVDIQKMLQTIGQFADTVQQVSPVIKQINDIIRSFRA